MEKTESDDDESAAPSPPSPPVPAEAARKVIKNPQEQTPTPPVGGGPEESAQRTLSGFLTFYPCMRFFCWLAHRQYPAAHRPSTRIAAMKKDHSKLYYLCVGVDFLLVVISSVLLLVAAATVLYKSVWLGVASPGSNAP